MGSTSVNSLKQKRYFVYELPYPERRKLCQILDADGKWEELGGRFMGVNQIDLCGFSRAIFHKGSPTSELLDWFGRGNGTVDQLFVFLHKMNHQWAMTVIANYVSSKYHHMLKKPSMNTSSIEFPSRKLSPSAPSESWFQTTSGSQLLGATGVDTALLKPKVDSYNFNKSSSQPLLLPPKLYDVPQECRQNSHDSSQRRQQASPVMNGTVSKVSNESHPACGNGSVEFDAAHRQQWPGPSAVERRHEAKCNMNLNIPVKKLNKLPETTPVGNPSSSDDFPSVMKIPYAEICRATNNFQKECILGQGGFGTVYKANWKGNLVAVKKLCPKRNPDSRFAGQISLKQSQTEMKVLYSCRIDNILPLYGVSLDGPEPCLIYQYMINGSLEDRLLLKGNSKPLSWDQRSRIAWGTAKGLNYLHSVPDKPLIHGDIKSANILLDKDMEPKIGDFGLARVGPSDDLTHVKVSSVHGTQVYLPPEYLRNCQLSEKVDVFSYGIVLLEIATGLRAYNEKLPRYKYLVDLVEEDPGDCDSLRDVKAGSCKQGWFQEILRIGKTCSLKRKASRPTMAEVVEKFDIIQTKISATETLRKLSLESPAALSPMELQLLYDIKNGPQFPVCVPPGVQGPPPYMGDGDNLPSVLPSIHTSEIREPPSQGFNYPACYAVPGSSTAATNGSDNFLPLVTLLRPTNQQSDNAVSPTGLAFPCNAVSGIPSDNHVVITDEREESSMSLFDNDGENDDDDDEGNEDDEDSYSENERLR